MGIAQFSSGLTLFNQQQLDDIQHRVTNLDGHKTSNKYVKTANFSVPAGQTLALLDVLGEGYLSGAIACTGSTGTGKVNITIDGVLYSWTVPSAGLMNGFWRPDIASANLNGTQLSGTTLLFRDKANQMTNCVHPLFEDLYFAQSLKIEFLNTYTATLNGTYAYHVGVLVE